MIQVQEKTTSLRSRMARGEILVAMRTVVTMNRQEMAAALDLGDYDFIYFDTQHVPYNDQQIMDFCKAAEELGYPVELRIPHTRLTYMVGRFCDLGPAGILVPEVMTVSEVDEALEFFYYPPLGRRSFGGATRYGKQRVQNDPQVYAAWWNENAILGLQIESVEAVNNAAQLAKPDVGYLSFGPTDLQFSLDAHPHFPLRTFEDCVRNVAVQLKGTGIALGLAIGTTAEDRGKYIEMGVTVFQEMARK